MLRGCHAWAASCASSCLAAALETHQGAEVTPPDLRLPPCSLCPNNTLNSWEDIEGLSNLYEEMFWGSFQVSNLCGCLIATQRAAVIMQRMLTSWDRDGELPDAEPPAVPSHGTAAGGHVLSRAVPPPPLRRRPPLLRLQIMFRNGPNDNAVATFCNSLAGFPNTPLGVLAAISNFTRVRSSWAAPCWGLACTAEPVLLAWSLEARTNRVPLHWLYCRGTPPASRLRTAGKTLLETTHALQTRWAGSRVACMGAWQVAVWLHWERPTMVRRWAALSSSPSLFLLFGCRNGTYSTSTRDASRASPTGAMPSLLSPAPSNAQQRLDFEAVDLSCAWSDSNSPRPPFLPCSALLWSAPPSIFGHYSLTPRQFAAWCKRVYGIERPLRPLRGLQFNQWHYKHVGNIIVRRHRLRCYCCCMHDA